MADSVAQVIVKTLAFLGVKRIYGIPGDSLNPLMDALRTNTKIEFIQVRHEEGAALEAAFEAKFTGNPAVCVGTSGPGSVHLLNGLYEAKMDHVPVIALTGQVETDLLGSDYFQEVNLSKLFDDVSLYNQEIRNPASVMKTVETAYRKSLLEKGVAHLTLPVDVLRMSAQFDQKRLNRVMPKPDYDFDPESVNRAIDQSDSPLIFIGNGTRDCAQGVMELAEKIGAPVIYSLNAKGILDDNDQRVMGTLGLLGTKPSVEAMKRADLLIMIGTSFPYTAFLNHKISAIQVDNNLANLGKRYPAGIQIYSSAKKFLSKISPLEKTGKFYNEFIKTKKDWVDDLSKSEDSRRGDIKPETIARMVSEKADDDAVIVVDTGNVTVWGVRNMRTRPGRTFLFSPWLGSMGVGIPGSVGVSFNTDRQIIALIGDGSFAMTMMELITAKKYDRDIKFIVFNNSTLGMIKFEEMVMGYPEFGVDLTNPDFSKIAGAIGIKGFRVEDRDALEKTMDSFLSFAGPAVLDVIVNPDEKPMPPKLTFKEVRGYVTSILREELT